MRAEEAIEQDELANESLAGRGANTKNPFEAMPSVIVIWLRRTSMPVFMLCLFAL